MPAINARRFVSIFFTSNKIQIVLLDNAKKTVEKYLSVDIGQGILTNRKVTDVDKLSLLLSQVWTKYDLKEKYVGIVVPEFSTYIKSLVLPKIAKTELDEAIRWQAVDIMPQSSSESVLDWKILETKEDGYTILAVSIRKDILTGYVEAVGKAGLYPIVLETPSIALTRLCDDQDFGKLLIYQTASEALIVVTSADKIYGSSITALGDDNIAITASRIVKYYQEIKIERVLVGGVNITQNLFNKLSQQFSVKVDWLQAKVGGMDGKTLQEYMVPISLQFKDTKEPRDETTINLLPPDWAKSYELKRFKNKSRHLLINSFLVLLTLAIMSMGFYLNLNGRLKKLESETGVPDEARAGEILKVSSEINKLSDKVNKITSIPFTLEQVLADISKAKTDGVNITSQKINFDLSTVELNGRAVNRLSLITFKRSLEESDIFEKVEVPISTLEKEVDIDFRIDITLKGSDTPLPGTIKLDQ